ncbi:MAG TPA: hypothetical protein VF628_03490 [Allosphingosinicella sp.]|jgi:hypothetical protein
MSRALLIAALPMLSAQTGAPVQRGMPVSKEQAIPARDGNIAIQEEYCAARKAGTAAAYDLFIARHPQHPLAAQARADRAQLRR